MCVCVCASARSCARALARAIRACVRACVLLPCTEPSLHLIIAEADLAHLFPRKSFQNQLPSLASTRFPPPPPPTHLPGLGDQPARGSRRKPVTRTSGGGASNRGLGRRRAKRRIIRRQREPRRGVGFGAASEIRADMRRGRGGTGLSRTAAKPPARRKAGPEAPWRLCVPASRLSVTSRDHGSAPLGHVPRSRLRASRSRPC